MSQAEAPARFGVGSWREIRRALAALPLRALDLWRHSLQFRTVLITFALSSLAIFVIGLYISFSIASNLFKTQLDSALGDANDATIAADDRSRRVVNARVMTFCICTASLCTACLLYTSPSPRDGLLSRMPSSA